MNPLFPPDKTGATEGEACRWFCGARAWGLGIEKAVRTDPENVLK